MSTYYVEVGGGRICHPQNEPLWHVDYFELKGMKTFQADSGKAFYLSLNCLKEFR